MIKHKCVRATFARRHVCHVYGLVVVNFRLVIRCRCNLVLSEIGKLMNLRWQIREGRDCTVVIAHLRSMSRADTYNMDCGPPLPDTDDFWTYKSLPQFPPHTPFYSSLQVTKEADHAAHILQQPI